MRIERFKLTGGTGILFEAKATKQKSRWHYPKDRRHQYDYIQQALMFGVISFYLIYWYEKEEVRLYPATTMSVWGMPIEREKGKLVHTDTGIVDWREICEVI